MDHERYRHMHGQTMSVMKKAEFEVALKGKKQIAEGTEVFAFEKPPGFHFRAGQHLRMTLMNPPETDRQGTSRFFSLASTPQDEDVLVAMRMRDTAFKRVLGRMAIGQKVLIQILLDVPHGAFALHDNPGKLAVMLAGGIGIVPAYSMIKDATERKLPHTIVLFYSNRRPEDAPFLDELGQLARQNPHFTLVPIMTEPEKSSSAWSGETGFINKSMLTKYVQDLHSPIYYIAGLPAMTTAMKKLLADLGVNENNIQTEEFSGFDLNRISDASAHKRRPHIIFAVIIFSLATFIFGHVAAAGYIINSDFLSLKNPFLYIMIGFMLILIPFKLRHLLKFRKHIRLHE